MGTKQNYQPSIRLKNVHLNLQLQNMRHLIALLFLVLFTACSNSNKDEVLPSALIIPQPQQVESTNGHFELPKEISISAIVPEHATI